MDASKKEAPAKKQSAFAVVGHVSRSFTLSSALFMPSRRLLSSGKSDNGQGK
jgi:hypothetical protein